MPEPTEVASRADFSRIRYAQCWEDAAVLVEARVGFAQADQHLVRVLQEPSALEQIRDRREHLLALDAPGDRAAARLPARTEHDDGVGRLRTLPHAREPLVEVRAVLVQDEEAGVRRRLLRTCAERDLGPILQQRNPGVRAAAPILPGRDDRHALAGHGLSPPSGSGGCSRTARCRR